MDIQARRGRHTEYIMKKKRSAVFSLEKWKTVLLLLLAAVTVKMIFVASNVDEEYGIELAYRIAKGDRLLTDLWEPHQTSAIFGALLVKIFWIFTGKSNTGIVLYMHFAGAIFQLTTAWLLYRVLRQVMQNNSKKIAFAVSCIYAISYPKGVIAPEYSNLQNWFTTCAALMFLLYCKKARDYYLIMTGVFLSGAILAYPSMFILYPVLVCILFGYKKKNLSSFWKAFMVLTVPCVLIGGALILYIHSYCSFPAMWQNINYILGDGSHSATLSAKLLKIAKYGGIMLVISMLYLAVATGITTIIASVRKIKWQRTQFIVFTIWVALLVAMISQVGIWLFGKGFVNTPQDEMLLLAIIGLYLGIKRKNDIVKILTIFSITGFIATLMLSNFKVTELIVYLCLAAIGGILALLDETKNIFVWKMETKSVIETKEMPSQRGIGKLFGQGQSRAQIAVKGIVICWVVVLAFGRIWVTSQGGELHTTLLDVKNIQKSGPGIGIFTNYMTGYRYNMVASEWDDLIDNGDSVLYVGATSFYYMFGDVTISASNTISTPVYDESLLEYWKLHPDRYPDVILVESSYGELAYGDDSWIMQWINSEYQASEVQDYEYFRLYRK